MTWTTTDRANLLGLGLLVAVAVAVATPILLGSSYLPLMAVAAVTLVSAWRMSLARTVRVAIDSGGITKSAGAKTWRLAWAEIDTASFTTFLGAPQLLLGSPALEHWSASDRLYNLAPAGTRAVQVPAEQRAAVTELLAAHGLLHH